MDKLIWNQKLNYLKETRKHFWNDDYLEFLVKSVWKINKPIDVIDFGCGFGYLGIKLLPLLPLGSTYTGVDIAPNLLRDAKTLFEDSPYKTEFICADLTGFDTENRYGLVICQAVLRHIPAYQKVLSKMVNCCEVDGIVACIEVNRRMENAGLFISQNSENYDYSKGDVMHHSNWLSEIQKGGRDYLAGIKIPILLEAMGLKNVAVRVNDFVEFISPNQDGEHYQSHLNSFISENNLEHLNEICDAVSILNARCLLISYGRRA